MTTPESYIEQGATVTTPDGPGRTLAAAGSRYVVKLDSGAVRHYEAEVVKRRANEAPPPHRRTKPFPFYHR